MADQQFTQYAVVVFTDMATLISEVNALLSRGWTTAGGIQVSAQVEENKIRLTPDLLFRL